MKKTLATAAAVTGITLGCGVQPAFAELTGGNTLPSDNNLIIQKVDAQSGKLIEAYTAGSGVVVDKGATFTGQSCTRGEGDLNVSCEDLSDYSWFRDDLPEYGTTGQHFGQEIPLIASVDDQDNPTTTKANSLQYVQVAEVTAPTGYDKINGTATVYRSGNVWKADAADLPAGVTFAHSNGYAYLTFHDTKTPVKPIPPKPTPKPVRYYQHDVIKVTNKAQAAELAQRIKTGVLPYRGDKLSWGHSKWSFTTVPGHSKGKAVVGQTVDLYWALDTAHGAKPQQTNGLAWGPKHNLAQTLVR